MTNKVLLVRPRNIYNYNNYPSLGLIHIGTALEMNGYDVKIISCCLEENPLATVKKELVECLLVGITVLTAEVPDAYRIMKFVKENSKVPIVVGGWHSTLFPEQMADCEYIDYVVAGEGEEHIVEIANSIRTGFPTNKRVFPKVRLNLEKLPLPDYGIDPHIESFINNYLTDKMVDLVRQPMRWLPYDTSRGCPSKCTFCINVVTGNTQYRKKSPEKVVAEVEHLVRTYDLTHIKFIDDNFFVDIHRDREICQGMIEKELNITWDAECRCDYFNDKHLNDETLSLAKQSGLVQLTLGVESGSLHTLELMRKGITPEQGEYAVSKCNTFGIIARASFIIEVPGETKEDIAKTIAFVKRLRRYPVFTCGVQIFRPYPRCELTQNLIRDGLFREPASITEWLDKDLIELYVTTQFLRPWQVYGKYSETVAYYLTMESGVSLRMHQIERRIDRLKYRVFICLARIRNRLDFYRFPIDRYWYESFFDRLYERLAVSQVLPDSGRD